MFEVHFRGQTAFESEGKTIDAAKGELRAWKPTPLKKFECDEDVARARYAELVRDGVAAREVDDVVPFMVVIYRIDYEPCQGEQIRMLTPMLWQYAEDGAEPEGPWAKQAA